MNITRRRFLAATTSSLAVGALAGSAQETVAAPIAKSGSSTGVDDLCFAGARELARRIHDGEVSAREVMTAHLRQIARLNPRLNAIVAKLGDEECLALADAADRKRAGREPVGPLHGLPIAIKDTEPAVGFPF